MWRSDHPNLYNCEVTISQNAADVLQSGLWTSVLFERKAMNWEKEYYYLDGIRCHRSAINFVYDADQVITFSSRGQKKH